ncbi:MULTISPECIES: helix-turn-helix domain-containing protein [unclassified Agromyces]|uniref:helix-turn-helix domain-containing protein n=1 Tax=unclassified Agromyces TaxID=2639701 RepID=UPI0030150E25
MAGPTDTVELVLHPVRLRIIQALLGGRRLTTAQLGDELPGVTTATLYRQVATLADAGVLVAVDERRVRGAVERTWELQLDTARITGDDLAGMSLEEHRRAFAAYVAGLLAGFDGYLARGEIDFERDRVGYRHVAMWMTDGETDEFIAGLRELAARFVGNGPGDGRVRRVLSTVLIPDATDSAPAPAPTSSATSTTTGTT